MKFAIPIIAFFLCCVFTVNAGYDYVISEYGSTPSLHDYETLLMIDEGGTNSLDLSDNSSATIQGTSALERGKGGIEELSLGGYSNLEFLGGEVHTLSLTTYATATLSGGLIVEIWSSQKAWKWAGDPPQYVPDPHIEIVCDVDSVNYDAVTNILTGSWLGGSSFNIQLIDVSGYSPTIENIFFTPEPATLVLFGLGGILLRRRHCA